MRKWITVGILSFFIGCTPYYRDYFLAQKDRGYVTVPLSPENSENIKEIIQALKEAYPQLSDSLTISYAIELMRTQQSIIQQNRKIEWKGRGQKVRIKTKEGEEIEIYIEQVPPPHYYYYAYPSYYSYPRINHYMAAKYGCW